MRALFSAITCLALGLGLPATAEAQPVTCGGLTATIVGTFGDDILDGTPLPDVIAGLSGSDVLRAQ
jgi:hypothetical protein